MIKVSVRYCGGCNPDYDRTRLAADVEEELNGFCRFVSKNDPASEWELVIHGCQTACAEPEPGMAERCIHIRSREEAEVFVRWVRSNDPTRIKNREPRI